MGWPSTPGRLSDNILQIELPKGRLTGEKTFQFYVHRATQKNEEHIKNQRYYFANKVHLVKAMVFPVVMYGCESWTIKKAEHQRIDAFELWCWRRLLRVP